MKAVIQRVSRASVSVNGEVVSSIGKGLCVLVGIHRDDTREELEYIVRKVFNLRLFSDVDDSGEDQKASKRWGKSAKDLDLEILCISQFTLYNIIKGNKLDFHLAMGGEQAKSFYEDFLQQLRRNYKADRVRDGVFGAMMQVDLVNDGPVTVEVEAMSKKKSSEETPSTADV